MKKYIHILTALTLLAASCTKSEVNYEPSGQVTLAPVKGTLTKAAGNSGELKDLENPPKLHIWARWDEDNVYWYIFDCNGYSHFDSYGIC
jgi:hypothetical protein